MYVWQKYAACQIYACKYMHTNGNVIISVPLHLLINIHVHEPMPSNRSASRNTRAHRDVLCLWFT